MIYELPTTVNIGDKVYAIRSDYRAILDICTALTDPELTNEDKAIVALNIFYPDFDRMEYDEYEEAIKQCFWFINIGEEQSIKKPPKLMDWKQDFQHIIAPINRIMGTEVRSLEYLHWWTFIGAFYEIGDCTFAQIVRIRSHLAKGKKLDDFDKEWYKEHRDIVDLKTTYTEAEENILKEWGA